MQEFKHRIVRSLLNILSHLANLIVWASIGHSFGFWERHVRSLKQDS